MDCQHNNISIDPSNPCRECLLKEVERLEAENKRQHGDLVRTMTALVQTEREVERLKAENFSLAAHQCQYPSGDEFGNSRCLEIDKLRKTLEPMRKLLVSLKDNGSSHAFFIMQQAWGALGWEGMMDSLLETLKEGE